MHWLNKGTYIEIEEVLQRPDDLLHQDEGPVRYLADLGLLDGVGYDVLEGRPLHERPKNKS
jgi:hypothetical protein